MTRGAYWLASGLAAIAIALVAVNVYLSLSNRTLRDEVRERQAYINESIRLGRVNSQLIRALAVSAVRNKDAEIESLLARHGVSVAVRAQDGNAEPANGGAAAPAKE